MSGADRRSPGEQPSNGPGLDRASGVICRFNPPGSRALPTKNDSVISSSPESLPRFPEQRAITPIDSGSSGVSRTRHSGDHDLRTIAGGSRLFPSFGSDQRVKPGGDSHWRLTLFGGRTLRGQLPRDRSEESMVWVGAPSRNSSRGLGDPGRSPGDRPVPHHGGSGFPRPWHSDPPRRSGDCQRAVGPRDHPVITQREERQSVVGWSYDRSVDRSVLGLREVG